MRSNSETGHYKNVVNLNALKVFAEGLGTEYTPQKDSLKVTNLTSLLAEVTALHNAVKEQINTVTLTVDSRQLIYQNVKPLSTKVINTMGSTNVQTKTIEDVKFFNAKIQGTRIKKKMELKEGEEDNTNNSVSRQSYDSIYENFKAMNNLLQQDGNYSPEENDVKLDGLITKENNMLRANQDIVRQVNDLSNKRRQRNIRFYDDEDSLIAVAKGVKKYIRGKYGVNSSQFNQIKNLIFKSIKK